MSDERKDVSALRVKQWLPEWDSLIFDEALNQRRPKPHFYLFSMPAAELRKLAQIYRRSTEAGTPRAADLGIQRKHDPERSSEIQRYVVGGHPWAGLSDRKRASEEAVSLKKPGWLPTAVVVNILEAGDKRGTGTISADRAIDVVDDGATSTLRIPVSEPSGETEVPPIEVIDGQHRLFAFEDEAGLDAENDYEVPVVAFHGLDISWQAYLFWTINIKPKKINASLAFDLYPLLREQDWLNQGETVLVYRETRAQELTELLWAHPDSPWYRRINMLGGTRRDNGPVTQSAFIRSLVASMVKSWSPHGGSAGGLFGGTPNAQVGLGWSRVQQAAFLLRSWQLLAEAIGQSAAAWASDLRQDEGQLDAFDLDPARGGPAFVHPNSLLATDQGVRAFQHTVNDLCYVRQDILRLAEWSDSSDLPDVSPESVSAAVADLDRQPVVEFLREICEALASFDWRTSGALGLTAEEQRAKAALRGSGGYKALRTELAQFLQTEGSERVRLAAASLSLLGK